MATRVILWVACQRCDSALMRVEVDAGVNQYHDARERLEQQGCNPPFVFFTEQELLDALSSDPSFPLRSDQQPLRWFLDTIEATGGVYRDQRGYARPLGDEDWIDLGEAYVVACQAIGREPMVTERAEDEDEEASERMQEDQVDAGDEAETPEAATLTSARKQVHLRSHGSRCPYCGSDQIEGGSFNAESGQVWQQVRCLDCDRRWVDVYRLADVEE